MEAVARGWTAAAGEATAGAGELPTGSACPALALVPVPVPVPVLEQEPLHTLSRPAGLSEASCPSHAQGELLLYDLAVLQANKIVLFLITCRFVLVGFALIH